LKVKILVKEFWSEKFYLQIFFDFPDALQNTFLLQFS